MVSLVIYEHSEFNLYQIYATLKRNFPDLKLSAILGDVVDRMAVEELMRNEKPEIIFHAAAYKHVSLLEDQILVATTNNLIGTEGGGGEIYVLDMGKAIKISYLAEQMIQLSG